MVVQSSAENLLSNDTVFNSHNSASEAGESARCHENSKSIEGSGPGRANQPLRPFVVGKLVPNSSGKEKTRTTALSGYHNSLCRPVMHLNRPHDIPSK